MEGKEDLMLALQDRAEQLRAVVVEEEIQAPVVDRVQVVELQ